MNVPNTPPSTRQDQTFSLADGIVAFGLPLRAVSTLYRLHSTAASGRAGMRPSPPFLITGGLRLRCRNRGGLAGREVYPLHCPRPDPPAISSADLGRADTRARRRRGLREHNHADPDSSIR